jgi:hypothetical protein
MNNQVIPAEAVEAAGRTVEEFLRADFIIPDHGGSMASGFSGTAEDAQRIIDAMASRSKA